MRCLNLFAHLRLRDIFISAYFHRLSRTRRSSWGCIAFKKQKRDYFSMCCAKNGYTGEKWQRRQEELESSTWVKSWSLFCKMVALLQRGGVYNMDRECWSWWDLVSVLPMEELRDDTFKLFSLLPFIPIVPSLMTSSKIYFKAC